MGLPSEGKVSYERVTMGRTAVLCRLAVGVGGMWAAVQARAVAQPSGEAKAGHPPADEVIVPAGPFLYGSDVGEADERPARRMNLPAFAIDRTEVTRAAYARCVGAGKCRAVDAGAPGRDGQLPVTAISHAEAVAYCAFAGRRLPTEQEWEKAARGVDGRMFPWGDAFACDRGNFGNFDGDGRCAEDGAPGKPVVVGRFPSGASPFGALDLAGNVWEWVDGRYGYSHVASGGPELRVVRGGGCCSILGMPRASDRLALPGSYRDVDIGFRCARSLVGGAEPVDGRASTAGASGRGRVQPQGHAAPPK